MSLYKIIKELQAASGSNAKTAILQANKDNKLLQDYLKCVYDPAISYYQTKVSKHPEIFDFQLTGTVLQNLIDVLVKRRLTGDSAKRWLNELMLNSSSEAQELIELLIKRSVGAGVGDTMILNVFPELYFIPPYQRCSLMDDKIKAKFDKQEQFYVQLKLDGSFCYLVKEAGKPAEAITRAGSKYPAEFAQKLATGLPDGFVVVGELLVYEGILTVGEPLDRKTGNGILNSVLKGGDIDDNLTFQMTAWDCLTVDEFKKAKSDLPYHKRLNLLDRVANKCAFVEPVRTQEVISLDEAYDIYSEFTEDGKEGAVIKTCDFLWKDGTSKDCIKLKIEFECDLKVIGMTEGTGKAKGMMGSLTLSSSDGKIVTDCGTGFSDDLRKDWWEKLMQLRMRTHNDIIVTVKANDIITKRGSDIASLFLPVFLEERLDKTEADSYARCVEQLEAAKNGGKK